MTKKILLPISILSVSIVIVIALFAGRSPPPKKPNMVKPRMVQTIIAESEDLQFEVLSQGVVRPRTESNIVAQVSGVIRYISPKFVIGGYFKKGEVLVQIEDVDYQIAIAESKARLDGDNARLEQEKARVGQAEKEWALTGRSKKEAPALALRLPYLNEAQAKVRGAQADLRNAKLSLKRATIRAPYDGILAEKQADLGQFINVGGQLGKAFAVDYAEVRLPLSDRDMAYLDLPSPGKLNQIFPKVAVSAKVANQLRQWTGRIIRTEGLIDEKTRVHYAVVEIDDPYGILSDSRSSVLSVGTFVNATIEGKWAKSVIRLPREVLKGENTLLVMDDKNTLRVRQVDIVRADTHWIYIRKGIHSGEKVITSSLESRVEGMALNENTKIIEDDKEGGTLVAGKDKMPEASTSSRPSAAVSQ